MDIVNDVPTVVILLVASLIIGCIFGSFLNVVIWRVPNHISITNPKRSFCPKCESPIAWYDNIPIFSWLALGAKCRHCKEPIAARYPLVESLGGLSFLAVTAGGLFGAYPLWALPVLYVFACVSIVIAFIDLDHHLILNVVLLPTLIATVLLLAVASFGIGEWNRLGRGALCALILFVFYFVLSLIWKGGMGDGDIKLAFILGLLLGWLGWPQFIIGSFAAFFIGGAISLVLLASKKVDLHGGIPFGPSMLLGAWLGLRMWHRAKLREFAQQRRILRQENELDAMRRKEEQLRTTFFRQLNSRFIAQVRQGGESRKCRMSDEDWKTIFTHADAVFDNFTVRLRGQFPALNEEDIRYCCMVRMHLSQAEIAGVVCLEKDSVKKRLKRIRTEKLASAKGSTLEEILSRL